MRRAVLVGLGLGALALAAGSALVARAGWIGVGVQRPEGQWFWYLSRALGVSAYVALALGVIWGLLISTGAGDGALGRARSVEIHRWISGTSLALVAGHALVLVGDATVRFDALDLLVPFLAPYRPLAVGLGTIAAYGAGVVHASFWLRRRLGQRAWRMIHYGSFGVFVLATAHGTLAGSDGGTPWMRLTYLAAGGLVLWLTLYRVARCRVSPSARGAVGADGSRSGGSWRAAASAPGRARPEGRSA